MLRLGRKSTLLWGFKPRDRPTICDFGDDVIVLNNVLCVCVCVCWVVLLFFDSENDMLVVKKILYPPNRQEDASHMSGWDQDLSNDFSQKSWSHIYKFLIALHFFNNLSLPVTGFSFRQASSIDSQFSEKPLW